MTTVIQKVHSRRGPSSAHIWLNCFGSKNLIDKLGDKARQAGIEAEHGTAAHALLEICLKSGEDAWEHSGEFMSGGKPGSKFIVDGEMQDGVQLALDWARAKVAQFADKNAIMLSEHRLAAPDDPDAFGTSDIIIIVPKERLIVGDFKYGAGVACEPDDEQLRLYGHYAFETFVTFGDLYDSDEEMQSNGVDTDKLEPSRTTAIFPDPNTVCELYIIQPRIPHPKGPIRRHVTNRNELGRFFFGEALPALQFGDDPQAALVVGSWCDFCPAMEFCPALHNARETFNVGIDPVDMDDIALDAGIIKAKVIAKLADRMEAELYARSLKGRKFPNFKLVRKIASRVWKPDAEAELKKKFGDKAYSAPALLTPPGVERLEGGKTFVSRWAMKPETGLTIAPRGDKRDEVTSAMDEFDKSQGNTAEAVA